MGRQRREISRDVSRVLLIAWALLSEKQQHPKGHAVIWTELQNAFLFGNAPSSRPPEKWFILCFIRLDVFHSVLRTALQKSVQAYIPRSAWGILR